MYKHPWMKYKAHVIINTLESEQQFLNSYLMRSEKIMVKASFVMGKY